MGMFHRSGLKSQTHALADINFKEKHSIHLRISELWAEQKSEGAVWRVQQLM